MRLKPCAAFLCSLVLLAVGCSQSPVAPSQAPATVSAAAATGPLVSGGATTYSEMKGNLVPFSGVVTGELMRDMSNPQQCQTGATWVSTATGTALHMGRVTYHTEQCVSPGGITGKELVLKAADGDELHGTFIGRSWLVNETLNVAADFVFDGGTGRFANATGTARMTAALSVASGSPPYPGRWEWSGAIRY